MNPFLRLLIKFDDLLAKGEAAALIALVSVMTVIVFLQVVYRYVLSQPLVWSEELARYLFVWLSLLGAALALQKRGHFGFEILYQRFSSPKRRLLGFLIHILIGLLMVILLSQGITLVEKTAQQESPAMGIAMSWAYACIPVAAALMLFHLMIIFFKDGANARTAIKDPEKE